jgi:SecD/SecF fusion protein
MRSSFTWKIALCAGLVAVSLVIVGMAFWQWRNGTGGFKLGVDLAGGTILVYEVDQDKFSDARAKQDFEQKSQNLASALKKRIDPADLYNVTIRQVGTWRVEIILPTGGQHQADVEAKGWQDLLDKVRAKYDLPEGSVSDIPEGQTTQLVARVNDLLGKAGKVPTPEQINEIGQFIADNYKQKGLTAEAVQEVKEKISQVGSLEFRILANNHDDARAIQLAKDYFELAQKASGDQRKALADAAISGRPPPPPEDNGNPLIHTDLGDFTYSWVELGRLERATLGLDNTSAGQGVPDPKDPTKLVYAFDLGAERTEEQQRQLQRSLFWHRAAVARGEEKEVHDSKNPNIVRFITTTGEAWAKLLDEVKSQYKLPAGTDFKDVPPGQMDQLAQRVHDLLLKDQKRDEPVAAITTFLKDNYHPETFKTLDLDQLGGALLYSRRVLDPNRLPPADRDKQVEYFLLTRDPQKGKEVTGLYLQSAYRSQDRSGGLAIGFRFNQVGGDRFYDLTSQNAPTREGFHRFLAISLDNQIVSAPSLNAKIGSEGIIEGKFSPDEVDRYINVLNSGALPASLKTTPVSENTIGATLGQDTINKGFWSVLIAFVVVLAFMLVYYRFSGLVACLALFANLLLTVAFMVLVNATFTLPGLAGLVLMLGMAVDANVLIYERLREERDRGASLALAIRNGYDRAFPVILDTHLSSIFTAVVLYAVGNDQLKGFGISLTVGLVISLFTSLFMTRLMFDVCLAKGWLRKLSMMRLLSRPNIDFMAVRHIFFTLTIVTSLAGAALFFWRLDKGELNIDFVGGTAYTGQLVKPVTITELRGVGGAGGLLSEDRQRELLRVQKVEERGTSGRSFDVTYAGEERPRHIDLPDKATVEQVRTRASQLPDLSVEQIFVTSDDPNLRKGNTESALFTVRTSEKAPELVQAEITRLLRAPDPEHPAETKDLLKKIGLYVDPKSKNPYQINDTNTEATLQFIDLAATEAKGEPVPAYASPTQVRALLDREFKALDLDTLTQQFRLEPPPDAKQVNGQFQVLKLTLNEPLKRADLEKALAALQAEFKEHPTPLRLENFDSQLAAETQTRALYAILASWGAILLFLWFRFGNWTFGAAAVLCLIHDLFFTLGAIALAHYIHLYVPWLARALLLEDFKIDLPAVAALLTLVGYSVNDTIVVFDRIREVRGKNPELTFKTINDSVNQTLSRTLLTALTVFLVVIVLYIFGGEGVHLFAFVMVVGVFVGTYSSIYIASPLLIMFGEGTRGVPVRERAPQPAGAV